MNRPKISVKPPPAFVIQARGVVKVSAPLIQREVAAKGFAPFVNQSKTAVRVPAPFTVQAKTPPVNANSPVSTPPVFRHAAPDPVVQAKMGIVFRGYNESPSIKSNRAAEPLSAKHHLSVPTTYPTGHAKLIQSKAVPKVGPRPQKSPLALGAVVPYGAALLIQRAALRTAESKEKLNAVLYRVVIRAEEGKKNAVQKPKKIQVEKFTRGRLHAEIQAINCINKQKKPSDVYAWFIEQNAAPCKDCDDALQKTANTLKVPIQVKITGDRGGYDVSHLGKTLSGDSLIYMPA